MSEGLRAVLIHLVLPFAGMLFYLSLVRGMLDRHIEKPPLVSFLVIFATWGAFVVLVLTRFFWYWSGMATLGLFYLILVAPVVTRIRAITSYLNRKRSGFHTAAFVASVCYAPVMIGAIATSERWGIPFK